MVHIKDLFHIYFLLFMESKLIGSTQACIEDADCRHSVCQKGKCVQPIKTCPLTRNMECGGRGYCEFIDISSGRPIKTCEAGEISCRSYCECVGGYGGVACQRNASTATAVSSIIGSMCNTMLEKIGREKIKSESFITLLYSFEQEYSPHDLVNMSDVRVCLKLFRTFSDLLEDLPVVPKDILLLMLRIASSILQTKDHSNNLEFVDVTTIQDTVLASVDAITRSAFSSMVAGQQPVDLTSENVRIRLFSGDRMALYGSNLSPPHSSGNLPTSSITLSPTGLDACGHDEEYVPVGLLEMSSAVTPENTLGNIFRVVTRPPSLRNESHSAPPSDTTFELLLTWTIPQDWSSSRPNCTHLAGSVGAPCACRLVNYTPNNATFQCDIRNLCANPSIPSNNEIRSHSSSGWNVNDFGVVRKEAMMSGQTTLMSSSSDTSCSENESSEPFLIVLVCGVVGGLALFALWDSFEHRTFRINKRQIERAKIPAPKFTLEDAFTSSGVQEPSLIPFNRTLKRTEITRKSIYKLQKIDKYRSLREQKKPTEVEAVTETQAQSQSQGGPVEKGAFGKEGTLWSQLKTPANLLRDDVTAVMYVQMLLRHHSLLRMFTYGSLRMTRVLRFLCFATDIILLLFVDTLFYSIAYPVDNGCSNHKKFRLCIAEASKWIDGETLCKWNWLKLRCSMRHPTRGMKYYVMTALLILAVCIIPLTLIRWAFEYVYTKEIILAIQAQEDGSSVSSNRPGNNLTTSEQATRVGGLMRNQSSTVFDIYHSTPTQSKNGFSSAKSSISLPINETESASVSASPNRAPRRRSSIEAFITSIWPTLPKRQTNAQLRKIREVERDVLNQPLCDEHLKNQIVIRHFIDEYMHPIERFFIRSHFFQLDNAQPETLGIMLWMFTLFVTVGCLGYCIYYIFQWLKDVQDNTTIYVWGMTFFFTWAFEVFLCEIVAVYIVYVLPIAFIRGKLRDIYSVMMEGLNEGSEVDSEVTTLGPLHREVMSKIMEEEDDDHDNNDVEAPSDGYYFGQTNPTVLSLSIPSPTRTATTTAPRRSTIRNYIRDMSLTYDTTQYSEAMSPTTYVANKLESGSHAKDASSFLLELNPDVIEKLRSRRRLSLLRPLTKIGTSPGSSPSKPSIYLKENTK